ncbi:MAG: hypothetical protein H0T92_08200 [Pyrinomonadaceae bacterium]|nr:hypothetical protein [Pyrinomonadaceae bacterium]
MEKNRMTNRQLLSLQVLTLTEAEIAEVLDYIGIMQTMSKKEASLRRSGKRARKRYPVVPSVTLFLGGSPSGRAAGDYMRTNTKKEKRNEIRTSTGKSFSGSSLVNFAGWVMRYHYHC